MIQSRDALIQTARRETAGRKIPASTLEITIMLRGPLGQMCFGMGFVAVLIAILVAEFGFVLWLRGMTIREYLPTRDPISGTAYVSLMKFSIMPIVVERTNL